MTGEKRFARGSDPTTPKNNMDPGTFVTSRLMLCKKLGISFSSHGTIHFLGGTKHLCCEKNSGAADQTSVTTSRFHSLPNKQQQFASENRPSKICAQKDPFI